MIMAGGVLSIIGLYGLGYREKRQSREDVAAAAYADAVISPLVAALSATNVTWRAFNSIEDLPDSSGWGAYLDRDGSIASNPEGRARSVFQDVVGKVNGGVSWPASTASGGLKAGLVVMHDRNSGVVRIAFKATRNEAELMAMPMFYTEVRFQGRTDKLDGDGGGD